MRLSENSVSMLIINRIIVLSEFTLTKEAYRERFSSYQHAGQHIMHLYISRSAHDLIPNSLKTAITFENRAL